MKSLLKKSIFTRAGLTYLHDRRQALSPTEGNRKPLNMLLAGMLVMTLMTALFTLMLVQSDVTAVLRSIDAVSILPHDALKWRIFAGAPVRCTFRDDAPRNIEDCLNQSAPSTLIYEGFSLFDFDAQRVLGDPLDERTTFYRFETVIPGKLLPRVAAGTALVIGMTPLRFGTASVQLDGRPSGVFFDGERMVAKIRADIDSRETPPRDLILSVTFSAPTAASTLLAVAPDSGQVVIAEAGGYQRYADVLAAKRSGHGKQLADIARIVLAVFCLLLFILVDSSPESLGLALFMGIKAAGVIIAQNWLPEAWLSASSGSFLRAFLLCFGDILQLYFFTQLARVSSPSLKRWFLIGAPLAALYALAAVNSVAVINVWKWRNVSIGVGCMLLAWTSAIHLFRQGLYYRTLALIIAFSGTIVQVAYPFAIEWPSIANASWFQTAYNILETHTPYVFALSTFINISTMERRVKALSRELIAAKEIEREMALGKTVQQSFLRLPEVPSGIGVACQHDAAVYVSGDIYFVNWDDERQILTLVITDVAGHGVQAALKASICTTIADSIWCENKVREHDAPESRMQTYDARLHSFLSKVANEPEVISFVGGEFDLASSTMTLYRVNAVFPIIVEPQAGVWTARLAAIRNREATTLSLAAGGFVIFISDGYVDSSRMMNDFIAHLSTTVRDQPSDLNAEALKRLITTFPRFSQSNDDKTLLVFRFDGAAKVRTAA